MSYAFKILMVKEFFGTDFTDFHCFICSAEWSPQPSGLAQPPGLAPKVEGAALGSGAKVQSRATLLWGLTPVIPPTTEDFTLGPDPRVHTSIKD